MEALGNSGLGEANLSSLKPKHENCVPNSWYTYLHICIYLHKQRYIFFALQRTIESTDASQNSCIEFKAVRAIPHVLCGCTSRCRGQNAPTTQPTLQRQKEATSARGGSLVRYPASSRAQQSNAVLAGGSARRESGASSSRSCRSSSRVG